MKPTVNVVFNAHHPKDTQPLDKFFDKELKDTHHLDITVGYISEKSLQYLLLIAGTHPDLTITLTCGMHAREGMTAAQLHHARVLHDYLSDHDRGGVFVIPRLRYHGKIYLFHKNQHTDPIAYIGSANLSAIVPGYTSTFETGVILDPAPEDLVLHLNRDVVPLCVPIDTAHVPIIKDQESPMKHVAEATAVSTSDVVAIMSSPFTYSFDLKLKATASSNLNAHNSGGGARKQKNGSFLARNWYEGEIIVGVETTRLPGYPQNKSEFTAVTDDGWSFVCKISGGNGKNLRSKGDLSILGTWLKSRFIEQGALEYGEDATQENIDRFGRTHMTMRYHPDFDVWSFDLSQTPKPSTQIGQD